MWETMSDLSSPENPGKLPMRRETMKKSKWLMFTQSKTEKGESRCLCGREKSLETFYGPQIRRLALHCGLNNKIKNTYLFFESSIYDMALFQTVEQSFIIYWRGREEEWTSMHGVVLPIDLWLCGRKPAMQFYTCNSVFIIPRDSEQCSDGL